MTLYRHALNDAQWARISSNIHAPKSRHGRDDRLFLDAVLWIAKTGSPWRDMPERLGSWAQVYQRCARWCDRGYFEALFQVFQDPDLEQVMVDSTSRKAHQASAGAQAIGASRGGLNTKIHAVCDALGNPINFKLTRGDTPDTGELLGLIDGLAPPGSAKASAFKSFETPR